VSSVTNSMPFTRRPTSQSNGPSFVISPLLNGPPNFPLFSWFEIGFDHFGRTSTEKQTEYVLQEHVLRLERY
jgi:hypothetical protein